MKAVNAIKYLVFREPISQICRNLTGQLSCSFFIQDRGFKTF